MIQPKVNILHIHVPITISSIAGLCLWLFINGATAHAKETKPIRPNSVGRFELHAKNLILPYVRLQLPECVLLDYTGKNDPNHGSWQLTIKPNKKEPTLWLLRLDQATTSVRRRIEYVVLEQSSTTGPGHLEPILASEWTLALKYDTVLDCNQTIDWVIKDRDRNHDYKVEPSRAAHWVRYHLDQVYSIDILLHCSDYFWHHTDAHGPSSGFSHVIACTNRQIELDPQAIEAYTTNAWLLWSDWVSWTLDPKKVPDRQDGVDQAIHLLEKGHVANPKNAAFHLDAARTISPLARHHRPDLMGDVLRYYHQAHSLTSDKTLLIRIRNELGHCHRTQDQPTEALRWYRAVLELDAENRVALRYIKTLTNQ